MYRSANNSPDDNTDISSKHTHSYHAKKNQKFIYPPEHVPENYSTPIKNKDIFQKIKMRN